MGLSNGRWSRPLQPHDAKENHQIIDDQESTSIILP